MSNNTPTPQEPAKETVRSITEPMPARRTLWAAGLAIALALPELIHPWLPLVPHFWSERLMALGVTVAAVAAIAARTGGVDAAARVLEKTQGKAP